MARMIFVNLPVRDLAKSTAFYQAIGFTQNPDFSNAQASAMLWSDTIWVMLLDHAFYATFTSKRIIDAKVDSAALLCLSFETREEIDAIHRNALAAGGREARAIEDQGFMYGGAFDDPDGHGWETVWMDMQSAAPAAETAGKPG